MPPRRKVWPGHQSPQAALLIQGRVPFDVSTLPYPITSLVHQPTNTHDAPFHSRRRTRVHVCTLYGGSMSTCTPRSAAPGRTRVPTSSPGEMPLPSLLSSIASTMHCSYFCPRRSTPSDVYQSLCRFHGRAEKHTIRTSDPSRPPAAPHPQSQPSSHLSPSCLRRRPNIRPPLGPPAIPAWPLRLRAPPSPPPPSPNAATGAAAPVRPCSCAPRPCLCPCSCVRLSCARPCPHRLLPLSAQQPGPRPVHARPGAGEGEPRQRWLVLRGG